MSLFGNFPYIENNNIILKKMDESDALALLQMTQNEKVYRFLPTFLIEQKYEDKLEVIRYCNTVEFETKNALLLGIYQKENGTRFCGIAEIYNYDPSNAKVTIGYRLAEYCWGKGIATETVRLLTQYLFKETEIETIIASHISDNPASGKVLEKNGFMKIAANVEEDWGYKEKSHVDKWALTKNCRNIHKANLL